MTAEKRIGEILRISKETISCAESCTGGNIAHKITLVPGSSVYFLGGVVSYSVSVKENLLGVDGATIRKFGVVSREVAEAMAIGVRNATGSTYSVATTGLAGPGGDGVLPEGTVCIAACGPKGIYSEIYRCDKGRKGNIEAFSRRSLQILRNFIENKLIY